jgi:hypothetical protein
MTSDETPPCPACGKPLDPVNFERDDRSIVLCFNCGELMVCQDGQLRSYSAEDLMKVLKRSGLAGNKDEQAK